ncbi:MAG: hypothetical protein EA383_09510 [Spirochaetaceae bacterium]|nr:MAG: hypothetical protein EA383_09510 [Spirochaetaceae bacterium]
MDAEHRLSRLIRVTGTSGLLFLALGVLPSPAHADSRYFVDGFTLRTDGHVDMLPASEYPNAVMLRLQDDPRRAVELVFIERQGDILAQDYIFGVAIFHMRVGPAGDEAGLLQAVVYEPAQITNIDGDQFLTIHTDGVTMHFYLFPISDTPGGLTSHGLLIPHRAGHDGLTDIIDILPRFHIDIEKAAG